MNHPAFDRQIDLGREIIALLGDRGLGAVAGNEFRRRRVEDRPRRGDERGQVRVVSGVIAAIRPYPRTAARACGKVNLPA